MKMQTNQKSSLAKRNLQKFMKNRLAMIGLAVFIILLFCTLAAPLLTKSDPTVVDSNMVFADSSPEHILGYDSAGRDVFARLLYGGRASIFIGLFSAITAGAIGVFLGCLSGYLGRRVDMILLYIAEIVSSFPTNILIMILVGFAGRGVKNLIVIFTLTGWCGIYSLTRLRMLSLREESFVESCYANGISKLSIMFSHLLPNMLGIIIGAVAMSSAGFVLAEAGLSFLGLGVPADTPTWGNLINAARNWQVFLKHPALWIAPGIVVSLFVWSVNLFGNGLRDVLDTRM